MRAGTEANVWRPGSAEEPEPELDEPEPEPEPTRSYREGAAGSKSSGIGMSDDLAARLDGLDAVLAAREWEVYERDKDFDSAQKASDGSRESRREKMDGGGHAHDMDGSYTAADLMDTSPVSSPSSIPSPPKQESLASSAGVGLSPFTMPVGSVGTPRRFDDPSLIPAAAMSGEAEGSDEPGTPPHVAVGRLRPKHVAHIAASPLAAE